MVKRKIDNINKGYPSSSGRGGSKLGARMNTLNLTKKTLKRNKGYPSSSGSSGSTLGVKVKTINLTNKALERNKRSPSIWMGRLRSLRPRSLRPAEYATLVKQKTKTLAPKVNKTPNMHTVVDVLRNYLNKNSDEKIQGQLFPGHRYNVAYFLNQHAKQKEFEFYKKVFEKDGHNNAHDIAKKIAFARYATRELINPYEYGANESNYESQKKALRRIGIQNVNKVWKTINDGQHLGIFTNAYIGGAVGGPMGKVHPHHRRMGRNFYGMGRNINHSRFMGWEK